MNEYSFVAKVDSESPVWEDSADEEFSTDDVENGVREAVARWGYQVGEVRGLHYNETEDNWVGFVDCSAKFPFRAAWNGVSIKLSK